MTVIFAKAQLLQGSKQATLLERPPAFGSYLHYTVYRTKICTTIAEKSTSQELVHVSFYFRENEHLVPDGLFSLPICL